MEAALLHTRQIPVSAGQVMIAERSPTALG
jgi:hypothetical protein